MPNSNKVTSVLAFARAPGRATRATALALLVSMQLVALPASAQLAPPPVSPRIERTFEYDAEGNLTKRTQGANATTFAYDALDRPASAKDPGGAVVSTARDGEGRVLRVSDARGLVTTYERDGFGNVTKLTSPDTGSSTQTFDALGRVLTRTDAAGVTATLNYDAIGRRTSLQYSDATGAVLEAYTWTYDEQGAAGKALGRLTSTTFPGGSSRYTYDANGRLASRTQTVAASAQPDEAAPTLPPFTGSAQVAYSYDGAGRVSAMTYPSGRAVLVDYDAAGHPQALRFAKDATTPPVPLVSDIRYAPFGPPVSWNMAMLTGSKPYARTLDLDGRVVRFARGTAVQDRTYDQAGTVASDTQRDATTGDLLSATDFGHTALRLTSATAPGAPLAARVTFSYDASGNRLSNGGASYEYATDSNRLLGVTQLAPLFGSRMYEYTPTGSVRVERGIRQYAGKGFELNYAPSGGVSDVTGHRVPLGGLTRAHYGYDDRGLRTFKTVGHGAICPLGGVCFMPPPTTAVHFVYDGAGRLLGEYDLTTGAPLAEYVWLGDLPVVLLGPDRHWDPGNDGAYVDNSADPSKLAIGFIETDALGAPSAIVTQDGSVAWEWNDANFGTTHAGEWFSDSGIRLATNLRFPGQYFDEETQFHYNWHRTYDPETGRYLQSDPIGLAAGPNTYAYVDGNPISSIDPRGLLGIGITAGGSVEGGVVVAGAGATASVGAGCFGGGPAGLNVGAFASAGAFVGGPGYGKQYPTSYPQGNGSNVVGGGFVGVGVGPFITNATSAAELRGPFDTYTFNVGVGPIQLTVQVGESAGIVIGSITVGPGIGISGSTYPTNTIATGK